MKHSLTDSVDERSERRFPRRRFDFVIGNPPYIGYNEASKSVGVKLFRMMKEGSVRLSNIYGWNLHSAPGRQKKYPPKPNLYAFFLALGFALLKDNGRFCYIIPQTVLTEPDYDVVRHHLSHDYTIESLITFAGKLFVGRGTSQRKEVNTSSLILVATKSRPPADHTVECVRSPDTGRGRSRCHCEPAKAPTHACPICRSKRTPRRISTTGISSHGIRRSQSYTSATRNIPRA